MALPGRCTHIIWRDELIPGHMAACSERGLHFQMCACLLRRLICMISLGKGGRIHSLCAQQMHPDLLHSICMRLLDCTRKPVLTIAAGTSPEGISQKHSLIVVVLCERAQAASATWRSCPSRTVTSTPQKVSSLGPDPLACMQHLTALHL